MNERASAGVWLPLIGRTAEMAAVEASLGQTVAGRGAAVLIEGAGGVGKTRLVTAVAEDAARRGWQVLRGRAYAAEKGVPYALFSDAFVPLMQALGPAKLTMLARGSEADLAQLFPAAIQGESKRGIPAESATQLYWSCAQFLKGLAGSSPVLLVLDDLHWADASSLELLHFLARHLSAERVAVLATINDAEREMHPTLRGVQQSLQSLGLATSHAIQPLSLDETRELVSLTFSVEPAVTRDFATLLYGWTRGNPYFIEETLKSLVGAGRLRRQGASWIGWELSELELPRTIKDAIQLGVEQLSARARAVIEVLAVVGTHARYELLRRVTDLPDAALVEALEELSRSKLVIETEADSPEYDFLHPLQRQAILAEISRARRQLLHGSIADALEKVYEASLPDHVDELAFHFAGAGATGVSPRAAKYLAAAGRQALARFANREAADYLAAALKFASEQVIELSDTDRFEVMADLARARRRLGEFEEAITLWSRALDHARTDGNMARVATAEANIAQAEYWSGHPDRALRAFERATAAAEQASDPLALARIRVEHGSLLHALGAVEAGEQNLRGGLAAAELAGDDASRARAHRALALFHLWSGPADLGREHGDRAIPLAHRCGDLALECTCHWASAVLAGMTGNVPACDHHMREAQRLAEELHSPQLRITVAEIAIEFAYSQGEWDTGISIGEGAIALARSLNLRSVLPRLLVWTALIHLGRNDRTLARQYLDEAWQLSGADSAADNVRVVHAAVPAHIGLASYHLITGDLDEAIRIGEAGLAIVDRTGFTAWSVHRLLPILTEAYLIKRDFANARRTAGRLRAEARVLQNKLGLAWADACDAVEVWLDGDAARGAVLLRQAAEKLEAVPFIPDAARLRRQLAGRLADIGDREGAIRELRHVHEVFARLGAEIELEKTRVQFHEVGARPPARTAGRAAEGLTAREIEIIRLAAAGKSNKAIATRLGISARTVSTHLSNIFRKLEVGSRGELLEYARTSLPHS